MASRSESGLPGKKQMLIELEPMQWQQQGVYKHLLQPKPAQAQAGTSRTPLWAMGPTPVQPRRLARH